MALVCGVFANMGQIGMIEEFSFEVNGDLQRKAVKLTRPVAWCLRREREALTKLIAYRYRYLDRTGHTSKVVGTMSIQKLPSEIGQVILVYFWK